MRADTPLLICSRHVREEEEVPLVALVTALLRKSWMAAATSAYHSPENGCSMYQCLGLSRSTLSKSPIYGGSNRTRLRLG